MNPHSQIISLKVIPHASRNEVIGWMADGKLKVKVQAPAEGSRANAAVIQLLAKEFGLAEQAISLQSGLKSPYKQVLIQGQVIIKNK